MGYTATYPRQRKTHPTAKNRVWGFFAESNKSRPANRLQPAEPRRKIDPTTTKPASGVFFYGYRYYDPVTGRWPSRDPLGDVAVFGHYSSSYSLTPDSYDELSRAAFKHPYRFGPNSPCYGLDIIGLWWVKPGLEPPESYNTFVTDGKGGLMIHIGKPNNTDAMARRDVKCCNKCLEAHEQVHLDEALKQNPNIGKDEAGKALPPGLAVLHSDSHEWAKSELAAHEAEKKCLEALALEGTTTSECKKHAKDRIKFIDETMIPKYEKMLKDPKVPHPLLSK